MYLLATVLTLALAAGGQTAAKPNFSGQWKMNAAKSSFGALPAPQTLSRTISHAEPALVIVEEQVGGLGEQTTTRKYVTDGTETTFQAQGTDVKTAAVWADGVLQVTSRVDALGMTFVDKMSLSPDGQTLTSQIHIRSPQGDVEFAVVFEKQ